MTMVMVPVSQPSCLIHITILSEPNPRTYFFSHVRSNASRNLVSLVDLSMIFYSIGSQKGNISLSICQAIFLQSCFQESLFCSVVNRSTMISLILEPLLTKLSLSSPFTSIFCNRLLFCSLSFPMPQLGHSLVLLDPSSFSTMATLTSPTYQPDSLML